MLLGGNLDPAILIANLLVLLIGMTIHEWSHNYVAWRMGDPEPMRQGRLTLNPFVHINWLGWIMFAVIGFGILGAAPISPYRMPQENRRWRWLAAVAAGPVSNLLIAALFALAFRLLLNTDFLRANNFATELIGAIFNQGIILNLVLFFFNLIPLSPLDGWQIVLALLPPNLAYTWQKYQQMTYYLFFGLILISLIRIPGLPSPLGILVTQPTIAIYRLLMGL